MAVASRPSNTAWSADSLSACTSLTMPGELRSHQQEHAVLEHELQGAPVEALGDAGLRREPRAAVPAVEARGDDGDHARGAELLRRDVGDERDRERDRGVEDRLVELAPDEHRRRTRRRARSRAPGRPRRRTSPTAPQALNSPDAARADAAMAVRSITRAVASLTSPSPSRIDTSRGGSPSRLRDRGRRHHIGRADDRAERDRRAEVEVVEQHEEHEPGDEGADDDEQHRECRDAQRSCGGSRRPAR